RDLGHGSEPGASGRQGQLLRDGRSLLVSYAGHVRRAAGVCSRTTAAPVVRDSHDRGPCPDHRVYLMRPAGAATAHPAAGATGPPAPILRPATALVPGSVAAGQLALQYPRGGPPSRSA